MLSLELSLAVFKVYMHAQKNTSSNVLNQGSDAICVIDLSKNFPSQVDAPFIIYKAEPPFLTFLRSHFIFEPAKSTLCQKTCRHNNLANDLSMLHTRAHGGIDRIGV